MYSESTVGEICTRELETVPADATLVHAAKVMSSAECGSVVVMTDDEIVGIWTETDALRLDYAESGIGQCPLIDLMSTPVRSISRDAPLELLDEIFRKEGIRHCLVVDGDGSPFGIVTSTDLVLALAARSYLSLRRLDSVQLAQIPHARDTTAIPILTGLMKISETNAVVLTEESGEEVGVVTPRGLVRMLAGGSVLRNARAAAQPITRIEGSRSLLDALNMLGSYDLQCVEVVDEECDPLGFVCLRCIQRTIEMECKSQLRALIGGTGDIQAVASQNLNLALKVIDASLNGVMITDPEDNIVSVNPAFTRATGYKATEVIGRNPELLSSGRHDPEFFREMKRQLHSVGSWEGEIWNRRKNGEIFPEWLSVTAITDSHGNVCEYASIFTDLTYLKAVEAKVDRLSRYDDLTGLPNRQVFSNRLDAAITSARQRGNKLAVVIVDVDRFNQINDTFGYSDGDRILAQFANVLGELAGNAMVSRLGGDTFSVCIDRVGTVEDTLQAVGWVSRLASTVFHAADQELLLTVSMGISLFPDDGETSESLIKNASTAMHKVKDMGRNGFQFYASAMSRITQVRLDMQSKLQAAATGMHSLFLKYQPQVDLTRKEIVGYEALLRWEDAKFGLVSPVHFIPLIEKLGLIEDVSLWVIRNALKENLKHIHERPLYRMAVNISTIHIRRGNLVSDVEQILNDLDYPAEQLELEITESSFMDDVDNVAWMFHELRGMGVSIAIDDFGTGYSNLSYLKRIPADILKIDGGFIRNLTLSRSDRQIVKAIIAMSHSLGLKVIAESVEFEEQAELLLDYGCDIVQGYLFSEPVHLLGEAHLMPREPVVGDEEMLALQPT
jgi:diguanylate cyclase (GGDEF)-like protein/PAS domain S-box-containing protein